MSVRLFVLARLTPLTVLYLHPEIVLRNVDSKTLYLFKGLQEAFVIPK